MRRAAVVLLLGALALAGCGDDSTSSVLPQTGNVQSSGPCHSAKPPRRYDRVVVVVMENHDFSDVAGHSPYLNALAKRCGLATDYAAVAHPSLPNYLALTSGDTHGISSDCTDCTVSAPSIFGQLHGDWREYLQSLPSVGFRGAASGEYAKKHNPAAYFVPVASAYAHDALPLARLRTDLANDALPRFSLVVPNLCSDEHDCPISTGDAWLSRWLPKILASPAYRSGRTAVFVTYDEANDGDNTVYTVVAAQSVAPHTVGGADFDHYSLLRTVEKLLGIPCLARACSARSMAPAFRLLPAS